MQRELLRRQHEALSDRAERGNKTVEEDVEGGGCVGPACQAVLKRQERARICQAPEGQLKQMVNG